MDNWFEIVGIKDVKEMVEVVDDALCFGFEFKVENHKLYCRETV